MNTNTNTPTTVTPKVTRKGSGRTKGSFSFVKIPLAIVMAKFADPNTEAPFSRKWAEAMGFTGLSSTDAAHTYDTTIVGKTPATAVAATVTDLDS
jgi:hypothetical protein